jgi:hypothetical protein
MDDDFDELDPMTPEEIAELEAELDAVEPDPMAKDRLDHIWRSAVNARWCDGCQAKRPFDPEEPHWSTEGERNLCGICTRRRRRASESWDAAEAIVGAAKRRQAVHGGTLDESIGAVIEDFLAGD